jgi:hypothetical protein
MGFANKGYQMAAVKDETALEEARMKKAYWEENAARWAAAGKDVWARESLSIARGIQIVIEILESKGE